ncbi:MAG: hypothetical protein FWC86_05375 [Coriobacteriia bacterium]|nr:hypothetical protein [Coriobacteriia bacterium]
MSSDYDKLNSGFTEVVDFVEPEPKDSRLASTVVPVCTKEQIERARNKAVMNPHELRRVLWRNNALALTIHILLGGSLLMLLDRIPAGTVFASVLTVVIFTLFFVSMFAIAVYPILGFALLKPLPRRNFLSVAAPAVFLAIIALIDFAIAPLPPEAGILTGGFNHIAVCGFCHILGPGIPLWGLDALLAPLTRLIAPVEYMMNPLTMLIAALYPSLLLYLGIRIRIKRQKVAANSLCRCADCQSAIQEHESEV